MFQVSELETAISQRVLLANGHNLCDSVRQVIFLYSHAESV